ncbi:MAG: hypothetical protein J5972_04085, partial [Eubacterium sp.]|nr:hypothetical protein [Eubacterium sp.]
MKQLDKTRTRWKKRVLSVTLAVAMVASGLPMSMIPTTVSLAAPGILETGKVLSSEHVKDQNVLTYYTIVANA